VGKLHDELGAWLNSQPPITEQDLLETTNEIKKRTQSAIGYTLPVFWTYTLEQYEALTTALSRLEDFTLISKLRAPKDYRPIEQQINAILKEGKDVSIEMLSDLQTHCSYLILSRNYKTVRAREWLYRVLDVDYYSCSARYLRPKTLLERMKRRYRHAFCVTLTPFCFVTVARPQKAMIDPERWFLHCDTGPAFISAQGHREYYILGCCVPSTFVKPPSDLSNDDILRILSHPNVDVRTFMLRKLSIERVLEACEAKQLDRWEQYTLYAPSNILRARALRMVNPTTGAEHFEWVPNHCKSVVQALNYRNRGKGLPIVLT